MSEEAYLDDDGGREVLAVEAQDSQGHRQGLRVYIGPAYYNDSSRSQSQVWISYQEEFMASSERGPVLLTAEVWRELNQAVETRLQRDEQIRPKPPFVRKILRIALRDDS